MTKCALGITGIFLGGDGVNASDVDHLFLKFVAKVESQIFRGFHERFLGILEIFV